MRLPFAALYSCIFCRKGHCADRESTIGTLSDWLLKLNFCMGTFLSVLQFLFFQKKLLKRKSKINTALQVIVLARHAECKYTSMLPASCEDSVKHNVTNTAKPTRAVEILYCKNICYPSLIKVSVTLSISHLT